MNGWGWLGVLWGYPEFPGRRGLGGGSGVWGGGVVVEVRRLGMFWNAWNEWALAVGGGEPGGACQICSKRYPKLGDLPLLLTRFLPQKKRVKKGVGSEDASQDPVGVGGGIQ